MNGGADGTLGSPSGQTRSRTPAWHLRMRVLQSTKPSHPPGHAEAISPAHPQPGQAAVSVPTPGCGSEGPD